MSGLPTLTLWQPWASLTVCGAKTIDTRSWRTNFRGPIAIHAAKRPIVLGRDPLWYGDYYVAQGGTWLHNASGYDAPMPFGAIVATARLVDCVPIYHLMQLLHEDFEAEWPNVQRNGDGLALSPGTGAGTDISDQLPYGDFRPGRWAWLLEDVQPTTERCPACWGSMTDPDSDGDRYYGVVEPGSRAPCPVCVSAENNGYPVGCCAPIPATGKPGLWEWRP
ncbi:MAG TPA: hypothetical protein VFJ14_01785 [Nocardioidaceae bacterium]|nr:hypothetical protein [Nocardioidaceae bacterium]